MNEIRLGIIGVGGMGSFHADQVLGGRIRRCRLAAVCDIRPGQMARYDAAVARFEDSRRLIRSGAVDAVLIATPHYGHTTIGIDALGRGLHVLVEKPVSVHKADAQRLIAAHRRKRQVFAAMFNQRTDPRYRKVRDLVQGGDLGQLLRVNWIITDWFRSEAYYASGDWRATWAGEGGGVLLNQCPHNLDLLQWICGMPRRVTGFCSFGKRHRVEVEDEVTAYLDYAGGATGVFITTTGEAPGTNRLEVCGEHGKVVVEGGAVRFTRNEVSCLEYGRTTDNRFGGPPVWNVEIPVSGGGGQHTEVLQNFVDAILDGAPLIAPAREGIHSVELANAMLLSSLRGRPVDLPLDAAAFARALRGLVRASPIRKKAAGTARTGDLAGSW